MSIQIIVTEKVSPDNVAMVDKGSMVGNTYTKNQTQEEISKSFIGSVKGEAIPTTVPTPYNSTTYPNGLYEKYDVKTAGTYTNFKSASNVALIVTADDLDKKQVQLWVQNGVAKKIVMEMPIITAKTVFDASDNINPPTMKAVSSYLGQSTSVTLVEMGINIVGSSNDSLGAVEGDLKSNSNCKAPMDMVLTSVVTNFSTGGTFKVSITNASNVIISTSSAFTVGSGVQETVLPNIPILAGQTAWIRTVASSTAQMRYSLSGGGNVTFIQMTGGGVNYGTGPAGSFYTVSFKGKSEKQEGGVLGNYISKAEANGYENVEPSETFGQIDSNFSFGNQAATGYYVLKFPFTTDKTINQINVNTLGGVVTFAIGIIDQWGKFIEDRNFQKNTVSGLNNIVVNETLLKNQFIAIKTPGLLTKLNTGVIDQYLWSTESGYDTVLVKNNNYSLAFQISVKTRKALPGALVKKTEFEKLEEKVNNLRPTSILTAPNGTEFALSISNDGTISAFPIGRFTKVLHLGNSILVHQINEAWWGVWGMAAKTRDADYAHRFLSKLKVKNPTAISIERNIAIWESDHQNYDKSNFDSFMNLHDYDLIVIRLGENVGNTTNYKASFQSLVNYVRAKKPKARIVIGGLFWSNNTKDTMMREVAQENGLTWVEMSGLNTSQNKSFMGEIVQGDDGQGHAVNNAGVAEHPNDLGMEAIATRLFNAL